MIPEEIQGFAIQQMPNATHQTFNEATVKKAQEDEVVSVRCAKYLAPYAEAVREEDLAMVEAQASELSQAIREWDSRRDVTYDSFLKIVRAMNALPNPTSKAAASKVLNYVNINEVNTQAQYDEETGEESGVEAPGEGETPNEPGTGGNGSAGGSGSNGGSNGEPTTPNEPSNPGSGSTGSDSNTGSGTGSSSEEKFTVAWYLPNGNPIVWYELAPGETIPETPECPEGYYWHPYPSTMPNHDLDIIPEPIKA